MADPQPDIKTLYNEGCNLSDAKAHVKELLYIFCAPEIAPA